MGMENLKEAVLQIGCEKTDLESAIAAGRRYPIKTFADTWSVSRSRQYEKRANNVVIARSRYYKRKNDEIFPVLISQITNDRTIYGYRRVKALLNR